MKLHERLEEGFFSEEDVIDLGVDISRERQVEHRDESLLYTRGPLRERVAVDWRSDALKDGVEQLRIESTDMTQGYS